MKPQQDNHIQLEHLRNRSQLTSLTPQTILELRAATARNQLCEQFIWSWHHQHTYNISVHVGTLHWVFGLRRTDRENSHPGKQLKSIARSYREHIHTHTDTAMINRKIISSWICIKNGAQKHSHSQSKASNNMYLYWVNEKKHQNMVAESQQNTKSKLKCY